MKRFVILPIVILISYFEIFCSDWNYVEFPVRISSNIAVSGNRLFLTSLDTTILGFWLEKVINADTFKISPLVKDDFIKNLANFDSIYDRKLRLFQGYFGGTLEYTPDGTLWLVGLCAFKNYRGLDSFLFKLYIFKDGIFAGITPMLFTSNMDTIVPLRSTRLLGSGGNNLPWLFESRTSGDTTLFLLSYSVETANGYAFFVKDTISFISSLRVFLNGSDVDNYGNLSYITNDLLRTISPKKTLRELRIDQMFPQSGLLCGLKIDKKNGNIYLFDRGFNLIKFDGNSWTFTKLPAVDTFPLDARKNALIAIDSSGNLWVTMSSHFKHIYKITPNGNVFPFKLPQDITGTLIGPLQIDKNGILYLVANKLYPDSSIKTLLYYLDTKKVLSVVETNIENYCPNQLSGFFAEYQNFRFEFILKDNIWNDCLNVSFYNIFGEEIENVSYKLIPQEYSKGSTIIRLDVDVSNFPNGTYFARIQALKSCNLLKFVVIN